MRSEDEDSNESWATQEEFTSELILRYRALTFYTIAHCIKDTVEDVLISLCSYYLGETVELQVYLC